MSDEELTKAIYEAMQVPYLSERHDAIKKLIKQHREAYASEKEAKLLNALGGMYGQYCAKPHGHDFMGAGEEAIEILEDYGIHDESRQWDEQSYDKLEKKVAELREKVGKL
jgi:hypothetical protein